MALAVLDGNQSATTLSSVVTGGEHIVAHSVVSLGSNAISNIATAVSGTTVCVGSISISGTPSVTGSISVLNFPASQSVTFGATTGSVSILNFPSTQTVTFGQAIVSASNITGLNNSVGTDGGTPANTSFIKIGGHQDGSNSVEHIVHVSAGGAMKVDASDSTVTFGAISGTVTIGNTVTIAGTVTANPTGTQTIAGTVTANIPQGAFSVAGIATDEGGGQPINGVQLGYFDAVTDGYLLVNPTNPLPISGTVTANGIAFNAGEATPDKAVWIAYNLNNSLEGVSDSAPLPISGTVTIGSALPTGTNRIGVVTIGAGTVTIGAGTAQIGSVTASISNSLTISSLPAISGTVTAQLNYAAGSAVGVDGGGNDLTGVRLGFNSSVLNEFVIIDENAGLPIQGTVTIGSALPAGTNQIGSVTANTFAVQGTTVSNTNFTSTTASTLLASFNATREVLTIFNEGAGNLHICAGATCTTIAYQVRLSAGDYYEVPNHQTSLTHSAVFATAGTARVTQVS
jgi:hypothetical protein